VSWFASAGRLAPEVTAPSAAETSASNVWTAPAEPGLAYLWVVLRDGRGGSDFRGESLEIVP